MKLKYYIIYVLKPFFNITIYFNKLATRGSKNYVKKSFGTIMKQLEEKHGQETTLSFLTGGKIIDMRNDRNRKKYEEKIRIILDLPLTISLWIIIRV